MQSAWERFERVSSLAFLKFGRLAGAYIADNVLAGVDQSSCRQPQCGLPSVALRLDTSESSARY
jgi:hypothetical protein